MTNLRDLLFKIAKRLSRNPFGGAQRQGELERPIGFGTCCKVSGMAVLSLLWLASVGIAKDAGRPQPTHEDVSYGPHERNVVDFYQVESDKPTPLVVYFHGGGWRTGSKKGLKHELSRPIMKNGISFGAANYRLTQHAPHPAQLHDAARAIQFFRSKAKEWNIDPTRIAAYGGSAGGSISLWLALHDDMADPTSDDPVTRQSTRLTCALGVGAQSTNDPRVIREIIPGNAYDQIALKPLFDLPTSWNWDTAEVSEDLSARLIEGSPITHLTKDDPPIFVYYPKSQEKPGNIHHANFGRYLKKKMNALNIECRFSMSTDYKRSPEDGDLRYVERNKEFLAFLRKHFKMNEAN